jgi:tight adherence protein B
MEGVTGSALFGILVAVGVMLGFAAVWRGVRGRDPAEERLQRYATMEVAASADEDEQGGTQRGRLAGLGRLLAGFGLGPRLAAALARADLPLTAAEFVLVVLAAGLLGFLVGVVRVGPRLGAALGPIIGLALGGVSGFVPIVYLQVRQRQRQRAFTEQLPDVLTLLVGALRAGHGLSQALDMLVDQIPAPAKTEFARVMRAVSLGMPVQRALRDMAQRVGSDDVDLVVTAVTVQYEMGGNLAETLETIGDTVRDRIELLRQVRVLTAQQRLTGYVLGAWPIVTTVVMFVVNPDYMGRLFAPGWIRLLPAAAGTMQVLGFFVMRRILDIEV